MAELIKTPEFGLNIGEIEVDRQIGIIHKRVTQLPDFIGSFDRPTPIDYYYLVGRSIGLLMDERWPLAEMIPQCSLRIVENKEMASGCECWIDMNFIEGQKLSQMQVISKNVADQLTAFLNGCLIMAKTTKQEEGKVTIPDLLGGVERPHKRFRNFIVERKTEKLYFVDVYPVAEFGKRKLNLTKRRYKQALTQAAQAIGYPKIIAMVEELKATL